MKNVKRNKLVKRGEFYYLRCMMDGKRYFRSTGMTNAADAQVWINAFMKKLRQGRVDLLEESKKNHGRKLLIGEVLDVYVPAAKLRDLRQRTIDCNVRSLMHVVKTATGCEDPRKVSVTELNADMVLKYRTAALTEVIADPVQLARTKRTVVSTLRQARAVFAKWTTAHYAEVGLPDVAGFLSADVGYRVPAIKYRLPTKDLIDRTIKAGRDLKDPKMIKAFTLAYDIALRSSEAAAAKWDWIEKRDGRIWMVIKDRPDQSFKVKGSGSARNIPIHAKTYERLLQHGDGGAYILPGDNTNQRNDVIKRNLSTWMRDLGWSAKEYTKTSHELRKLMGSRWFTELGPAVAQKWLGHATISTTCKYYADLTHHPDPLPVE